MSFHQYFYIEREFNEKQSDLNLSHKLVLEDHIYATTFKEE